MTMDISDQKKKRYDEEKLHCEPNSSVGFGDLRSYVPEV